MEIKTIGSICYGIEAASVAGEPLEFQFKGVSFMYNIDPHLYATNAFYRDLIDQMCASEQKLHQLQKELDRLKAEHEAYYRKQMIGYANQIPYSFMTPVSPYHWKAQYTTMQNNFVSYWKRVEQEREEIRLTQQQHAEQTENFRNAFRMAANAAAFFSKQDNPIASIVFDGMGLLTAGNLFEAVKSAISIIDTAMQRSKSNLL